MDPIAGLPRSASGFIPTDRFGAIEVDHRPVREVLDRGDHLLVDGEPTRYLVAADGLHSPVRRLLAVSLVGMAQVSARYWLTETAGDMSSLTRTDAAALVSALAWRGIGGYPMTDDQVDG